MLKQLRRKFVLVNMLLVSVVLLVVFAVQLYSGWSQISSTTDSALRLTLEWSDSGPNRWQIGQNEPLPPLDRGEQTLVPTFCVVIRSFSTTVIDNNLDITEDILTAAVTAALESDSDNGSLPDLNLRFLRSRTAGSTRIAFADTSWESSAMRQRVFTSLVVLLVALAAFFPVSLFLSRWAMKPTELSWKQQQQFVADASHELKTPLTILLADTDILLSHPSDTIETQRKWVEYIQEEGNRMKELVEDLLFLARSDSAAAKDVPRQRLSLSDLCWNCQLSFEPVAFERSVELVPEIGSQISVSGNEEQLRRLVNILLDNACKYCGERGTVTLTLRQQGDKAVLSVHNTGAPIPPEALPHLFERFYRVDPSRTRESGGHGLGLPIAASITEHHKGKITVESSEGAGTRFTVTLPAE